MKSVLVTGASGFVGSQVLPLLADRGYEVHAASRRRPEDPDAAHEWHEADLLDPSAADDLVRRVGASHLLHLAWCTEHGRLWESPENADWVAASIRLWRSFLAAGGERFVGSGSCAEYGWGESPLVEGISPLEPATLYGAGKDAVRRIVERTSGDEGSWAWGRLFFLYGPERDTGRLVSFVAESLIAGRPVPTTDGEQVRDYLHVTDAARALCTLVDSGERGSFNIGSGSGTRVRDIVEELGRISGSPELIELGAIERPPNDMAEVVADTTRIEGLGWSPAIGLEEGLRDTMDSLRAGAGG